MQEPGAKDLEDRSGKLTLSRVASILGASFTIEELHCSRSISDSSTATVLSEIAKHVKRQGDLMQSLELVGLSGKCTPLGMRKTVFFNLLKLSKTWTIQYLDWVPHGSYLAGLSGDTNICTCKFHRKMLACSLNIVQLYSSAGSGSGPRPSVLDTSEASALREDWRRSV